RPPPPAAITVTPTSPTTPTNETYLRTPPSAVPASPKTGFIPRMKFPRSLSGLTTSRSSNNTPTSSDTTSPVTPSAASSGTVPGSTATEPADGKIKKGLARKTTADTVTGADWRKRGTGYEFAGGNDIIGIVMLDVLGAEDLPRLRNMTRTGWDMDPFVVISFGKKVFRTRVIRHSRNPLWDEKLLFHVRKYETSFNVQLTIMDWDKLSSNDHIGDVSFNVKELLDSAPQPGENGLYDLRDGILEYPMKEYKMPLVVAKDVSWDNKNTPVISFKAKYQPYDALRQRFWCQYMKQYDADGTNALSHLEITSMLDSLGSTLSSSTISNFFKRYGKRADEDELTFDETIICLEEELNRPEDQKKRLDAEDGDLNSSVSATPVLQVSDQTGKTLELDQLDFSDDAEEDLSSSSLGGSPAIGGGVTFGATLTPINPPPPTTPKGGRFKRKGKAVKARVVRKATGGFSSSSPSASNSSSERDSSLSSDGVERVINVKSCPLCHRPRMNSKAEMDIMTHIAVCASQDWNRVDRIVVGNFVTASQAQRKWYTKVIGKLSSGDYKLGANSANIIVQDRLTGQLEEEKMQVYVRLGIRLLYKGMKGRMEGARARKLLKSLSIKQGTKYDSSESAKDIPGFIEFHNLNVNEILDPLDSFKTFNEFFYRKFKPSARPVEAPEDPYRFVSVADCRLMVFETVSEATRIWIKGREFSVGRLLGDAYKNEAEKYSGGALAIFRLAPQDYHRFHSPADGRIGKMTYISGEYYTVNPQAIRTALDVYGDNARKIVPIDSPQFGRVMAVCVGAMMVGSILTTVEEGQEVKRGQEFGYFAFGGSTIVLLFEKGVTQWDEDLLINGRASLETLVRVGMGLGNGTRRNH
ncbi:Phosphatidylserine decarboxylase proenzyme 3, partial [Leucoagaricus sp. SymC.cos]